MKYFLIIGLILVLCPLALGTGAPASDNDKKRDEHAERSVVVEPNVTVTLCVMSGQITVKGWNKNEVRARSVDAEQIDLKRVDGVVDQTKPAKRIDVFIDDSGEERKARGDCQASSDVELDVPQGATVQIQTRDGDISITSVACAYAGSQNGDICIDHVVNSIEAGSIGGTISVKDSTGRVSLSSAGGTIEVTNVGPAAADDTLEVVTVSGDIQMERVRHAKVSARSVNGGLNMTGALAHSGHYGFSTMSGDVTLSMPADASFQLTAKLADDTDVISDFPLTITNQPLPPPPPKGAKTPGTTVVAPTPPATEPPEKSPKPTTPPPGGVVVKVDPVVKGAPSIAVTPYVLRRITAVHGSGDAAISVASFSGTLRLQKN